MAGRSQTPASEPMTPARRDRTVVERTSLEPRFEDAHADPGMILLECAEISDILGDCRARPQADARAETPVQPRIFWKSASRPSSRSWSHRIARIPPETQEIDFAGYRRISGRP